MPLYLGIDGVYSSSVRFATHEEHIPSTSPICFAHHPSKGYGDYNVYVAFTNHQRGGHMSV